MFIRKSLNEFPIKIIQNQQDSWVFLARSEPKVACKVAGVRMDPPDADRPGAPGGSGGSE